MTIRRCLVALAFLLACALLRSRDGVAHAEDTPTLDMFAFGVELDREAADAAIYRTTLPAEIYRTSVQGLMDVRVFGGLGDVVPHALRPVPPADAAATPEADVPFFPLRGEDAKPASPLTLEVVVGAEARLQVQTKPGAEPAGAPEAYLLDLRKFDKRATKLTLTWQAMKTPVWADVSVEGSEDLERWHAVGHGVIASLDHAGQTLQRREMPLHTVTSDHYLRLRTTRGSLPDELTTIVATFEREQSATPLGLLEVPSTVAEPHVYLFDTGGPFLASEVALVLGEANTLFNGALSSADSKRGPFTERYAGRFYRLGGATPLDSPAVALEAPVRARYWKLIVDSRGGGVGRALPNLQVRYRPDEIVWVARAQGPFVLAYGSARAKSAAIEAHEIAGAGQALGVARVGKWRVLGGQQRLLPVKPARPKTPWTVYALWGVLALAALCIVSLSIRLATRPTPTT